MERIKGLQQTAGSIPETRLDVKDGSDANPAQTITVRWRRTPLGARPVNYWERATKGN